jgi:hypothetical protein
VGDVAQLGLHGERAHRAQQGGREEEGGPGEDHDGERVASVGRRPEHADDRHGGDRRAAAEGEGDREQGTRVGVIGEPPARPRTDGDPGEDDADDARERLQRHADVRREQAPGEDLEHQHAPGRDEHERTCEPGLHRWNVTSTRRRTNANRRLEVRAELVPQ